MPRSWYRHTFVGEPCERLSATVEADLLSAGREAVTEGRADSLSAWVNRALRRQADDIEHLARAAGADAEIVLV